MTQESFSPRQRAEWLRELAAPNSGPVHYADIGDAGEVSPLCAKRLIDFESESWTDIRAEVSCGNCARSLHSRAYDPSRGRS